MATQKEGYLMKEGKLGWKKKYCILQYNMMMVFDKEPSTSGRNSPKSTYNLSDVMVRGAEGVHRCGFQVGYRKNGDKKSVYLAANTPGEQKEWMDNIKEAAKPIEAVKKEEKKTAWSLGSSSK